MNTILSPKKIALDLRVAAVTQLHERYVLLRLTSDATELPQMFPGQFVEVRVDGSSSTFLRRPISICNVDRKLNELWLLVAIVGNGTRWMASLTAGDIVNIVGPLGRGFSPFTFHARPKDACYQRDARTSNFTNLLVGGGVGVAPLLYLGATLKEQGVEPTFLLGARSAKDLLLLDEFGKYGRVLVTTEDGSAGERGFVTNHSVLQNERFNLIQSCGPTPMMKAVAKYASQQNIPCEVSLENMMACGLGACLCCVEKVKAEDSTLTTNVCVCKEGPVFNIKRLLWE
jgi:dihydroorotate dehydrogenase electron transfer subunit